jgi:hypothetical protein
LEIAIVAGLTLVGLALRLRSVGNSLFGDELSTYSIITGHSLGSIWNTLNGHSVDLEPPLYSTLAWVAERLGSSAELLRLFSLLAGTATIPLTYRLGVWTVGRAAAVSGAALVALSPFLIFYSTEARGYALVVFLVLASTVALLEAIRSNRVGWWGAYAILACASMYGHYSAVFVLIAQFLWALSAHPDRRRGLIAANVATGIGFVPWLPTLVSSANSFGTRVFAILEPFGLHAVGRDLVHWAIGHPYLALSSEPGTPAIVLIVVGLAAGVLGALGARQRGARSWRLPSASLTLPLALAVATPVGLALYSWLGHDTWDVRNLITSWPGLALAMGALLASPGPPLRLVGLGLVTLGFAIGAAKLLSNANERPNYAGAARFILLHGVPSDPVAIVPAPTPGPYSAMDAAFAYAGDRGRPLLRVGVAPLGAVLRARPYAVLPATPAQTLAAQTVAGGGRDELFVVAPGTASVTDLLHSGVVDAPRVLGPVFGTGTTGSLLASVFGPLSAYLRAIAHRYAPVETVHFSGFLRLSVYVFRRR